MTMPDEVRAFHGLRLRRMLADLDIEPGSLIPGPGYALVDDASRRALTPRLENQTLCEGMISAVKLAASAFPEFVP